MIQQDFGGDIYQFIDEGWFNATQAAKRFGKEPKKWLSQVDTIEYLTALESRYGKSDLSGLFNEIKSLKESTKRQRKSVELARSTSFVYVKGGTPDNGGGTWLHPKLAVAFARWLDTDFAIWCDEQIDAILRGEHLDLKWLKSRYYAASSYRVLNEVLQSTKQAEGKEPKQHHFMNEAKLLNGVMTGEFKGRDREHMTKDELETLAHLEDLNAVLLARGWNYDARKDRLTEEAKKYQNRLRKIA
jgi:hypothetical protein